MVGAAVVGVGGVRLTHGQILLGDCRESLLSLPDQSVHCCVTSPPYFGLRDYGCDGQMGLEATPDAFVAGMVALFREVRRVLRDDGTLWLNLGDSYVSSACVVKEGGVSKASGLNGARTSEKYRSTLSAGHGQSIDRTKFGIAPKNLIGIPWRVAFALQADGWYLRQDIVWSKPNPMPESVRDRCTKAHEYLFMLSKSPQYYYDFEAIKEPAVSSKGKWTDGGSEKQRGHSRRHAGFNGRYAERIALTGAPTTRNKRSVWSIPTKPFKGAHFATFPVALIEPCILAGAPLGGTVLDPFFGAGTTGLAAQQNGRKYIGCELNSGYAEIARQRLDPPIPYHPILSIALCA